MTEIQSLAQVALKDPGTLNNTPLEFRSFGKKTLARLTCPQSNLSIVTKEYNSTDIPMYLSGNTFNRELTFFRSPLFEEMGKYFSLPYLLADDNTLAMQDVTDELSSFGPPNMPTEDQMHAIISTLARKDAQTGAQQDWLASPSTILKNTANLFNKLTSPQDHLFQQCQEQWPWLIEGYRNFTNEDPDNAQRLINMLNEAPPSFNNMPFSVQHGDFYFNNIGITPDLQVVAIDWENIMWAPIGYDFATLTSGMPPLPFSQHYLTWYTQVFNEASPIELTIQQLQEILSKIEGYLFLTSEIFDLLRFGYAQPPLPQEHKDHMRQRLTDKLLLEV